MLLPGIDLTGFTFIDGPRNYSPVTSTVRIYPATESLSGGRPTTIRSITDL